MSAETVNGSSSNSSSVKSLLEIVRATSGVDVHEPRVNKAMSEPMKVTKTLLSHVDGKVAAEVTSTSSPYVVELDWHCDGSGAASVKRMECQCKDWLPGGGKAANRPCKHIWKLASLIDVNVSVATGTQSVQPAAQPPPMGSPIGAANTGPISPIPKRSKRKAKDVDLEGAVGGQPDWKASLAAAISDGIAVLATKVEKVMSSGDVPLLIGPTGCGKTSACRDVATQSGWGFEEISGSASFADADLVGLRMPGNQNVPGVFARAFERARAGETVLMLLDEATRFNQRALDVLMSPLLPIAPNVAKAMNIECDVPVRRVEAPLWGAEWAPACRVPIILACNPWGSPLDPALVRRTVPLEVGFYQPVADCFDTTLSGVIRASWEASVSGELPLPMEYQGLMRATSASDHGIYFAYLAKLNVLDKAAAAGFKKIAEGLGMPTGKEKGKQ